ncbi:MAG: hypothetical protein HYZ28_00565 [Myxococcales bacterium]|nr:hypothetical protein [Myxococcales bacterium]
MNALRPFGPLLVAALMALACPEPPRASARCGVPSPGAPPPAAPVSWLVDPRTFVYGSPSPEYLAELGGTVIAWSVYWGGVDDAQREYVRRLRAAGARVASNFPTMQGSEAMTGDSALVQRAASRSISGAPLRALWIEPETVYLMCHNNPEWREFLVRRAKEHVDGEVDAIHIDEVEGNGGHLYFGCFCDYCMSGFRGYLKERHDPTVLSRWIGGQGIDAFDYRTYLREKGATTILGDPNPALRSAFVAFQYSSRAQQLAAMMSEARRHAGRELGFAANTSFLWPSRSVYLPLLDFAVFENTTGALPEAKHLGLYLLGKALAPNRPLVMFPDILSLANLKEADWPLFGHWLSEAAAAGQTFLVPHQAYTFGGGRYHVDSAALAPAARFAREIAPSAKGSLLADVAVLYDAQAAYAEDYGTSFLDGGKTHQAFLAATRELQKLHVPFEVVVVGDGEFAGALPAGSELRRFGAIVAPGPSRGAKAACLLDEYQAAGGRVVGPGELPTISSLIATDAADTVAFVPYHRDGVLSLFLLSYSYDYANHRPQAEGGFDVTLALPPSVATTGSALRMRLPDDGSITLSVSRESNRLSFRVPGFTGSALLTLE